jgi:hypothetical protein
MRKVVEQLDRPGSEAAIGRNIDMTLAFLLCSTKANIAPSEIPADLEPVAKQLRVATPYKSVSVLDVVPLRLQEGKDAEQNSQIAGLSEGVQGQSAAQLRIRPQAIIRKEADRYVRFDFIRINFRVPYVVNPFKGAENSNALISTQYQFRDLTLNTSGDFKEGQKTVLGKISGVNEDSALFVVVSVKILD